MDTSTEGIRKAAILVTALDRNAADRLLDQMSPAEARRVRDAVLKLCKIDPGERRRVIDEFLRCGAHQTPPAAEKPHTDPQDPRNDPAGMPARPPDRRTPGGPHTPGPPPRPPFGCLREAEANRLAKILADERPQMIALVLSHLDPEQSGHVLVRFAPSLQVEVIRRLVDLEETDPEVLAEIEQALQTRLSQQVRVERPRVAGWSAVAGIVQAAGGRHGAMILQNLTDHDPQLAKRLGPEPVAFDELIRLDDAALAAVFQAAGPEIVMLALLGAPEPLVQRVLQQLPPDEAATIRRHVLSMGPTRLRDVEEARRQIEEVAWQLAGTGQIQLPRPVPLAA